MKKFLTRRAINILISDIHNIIDNNNDEIIDVDYNETNLDIKIKTKTKIYNIKTTEQNVT